MELTRIHHNPPEMFESCLVPVIETSQDCPTTISNPQCTTSTAIIVDEIPTGTIDGSNATFITEFNFIPETVHLEVNGIGQTKIDDYNTSGNHTIILNFSPEIGEHLLISYLRI